MHTSHYTVNSVGQNSAQGYSDNFGPFLGSRCSVVCSASKGCDCSRISKFLAVANLCRDYLAASGIFPRPSLSTSSETLCIKITKTLVAAPEATFAFDFVAEVLTTRGWFDRIVRKERKWRLAV